MLSSHERRALEALDLELSREDPKLAAHLSGRRRPLRPVVARTLARLRGQLVGLPLVLFVVGMLFMALAAALGGSGAAAAALATGGVVVAAALLLAFVRHGKHG